ncbi:fasciclin domain-containing protein [Nocardia cyriacigeorgica]|uniref:Fasciclin domain-containing protein n=1 Tax=Nocardia cyriacigeorgica TaxID=135487 RepID=A0A5R8P5H4_9NOCA|nr:fasciclin domain-containing protein [Nocardia cyriacigeorgica]TLF94932.1 fasciclin domain-containing protein [Nocardia cyriacigeorgica]
MRINRSTIAIACLSSVALIGASACGDDSSSESAPATTTTAPMQTNQTTAEGAAADLVGPGCDEYAAQVPTGAGSVSGMAQDPVTVAASNNPMLTTLVQAVSGQLNPQVNLVDTLNGGEFTVFAPVDAAFAEIDPATIESLKTDSETLTSILTYHVVPGRIAPSDIAGEQKTVQGATVTVARTGDDITVGDASVICGGVSTANATVYMIDGVLMPPA